MDNIDEIANTLFRNYYDELKKRLGHEPRGYAGRKNQTLWGDPNYKDFRKMANICIEHKFNPFNYLLSNFDTLKVDVGLLMPRDFVTEDAIERYKKGGDTALETWTSHVSLLNSLTARLVPAKYKTQSAILADPQMSFPAWFRTMYLKPFHEGLCEYYGDETYELLREDRRLRMILREHAPENMKALEEIYGGFGDINGGTNT